MCLKGLARGQRLMWVTKVPRRGIEQGNEKRRSIFFHGPFCTTHPSAESALSAGGIQLLQPLMGLAARHQMCILQGSSLSPLLKIRRASKGLLRDCCVMHRGPQ
jgi:hypothetical protein